MKDLIRKILKETEEFGNPFDWANEILNKPISEAEALYIELKKFLEPKKAKNGSNYRVNVDRDKNFPEQDIYYIGDRAGVYESWFARDFNIKSLKSELERTVNQTRSEYVREEYGNLLKDLEPFFKKTMLREVEEFDWAKEMLNQDTNLGIKSLRKDDIVIPTCAKQEEYIVIHAGFKPEDIFSEEKHFEALLKRNSDKNTGGIYLTTENEMGRNCRFKLVNRPSLNENKEEEFDWLPKDPFRTEDSVISYLEDEDNYIVNRLTVPNLYSDKPFIVIDEKPYFIEDKKSLITNMLYNDLIKVFPGIEKGVLRRSIRKFLNQIV